MELFINIPELSGFSNHASIAAAISTAALSICQKTVQFIIENPSLTDFGAETAIIDEVNIPTSTMLVKDTRFLTI